MTSPILLDSITDADASANAAVVVSGSHGGIYPAVVASRAGARAVLFNDAGIGLNRAGIAGVERLTQCGMAAAGVDCQSARIGSAQDMVESGMVSFANEVAAAMGITEGMPVQAALNLLTSARTPHSILPAMAESRRTIIPDGIPATALLVDSASLVTPRDAGQIIIAGSHGGLIGGNPSRALKAKARFACFNDAGIGKGGIGTSRLPALQDQGMPAVTVSHASAIIGDAASSLDTGQISAVNELAAAMGIIVGTSLHDALLRVARSIG